MPLSSVVWSIAQNPAFSYYFSRLGHFLENIWCSIVSPLQLGVWQVHDKGRGCFFFSFSLSLGLPVLSLKDARIPPRERACLFPLWEMLIYII